MKIDKKDLIWSYFAQILKFGSGLFLLPIVLQKLEVEELAVWYLFASITSMVMLLDFGFSSTIIRNLTYVFAGAKSLMKEGFEENDLKEDSNGVDEPFLAKVIFSVKYIYAILALISFLTLASIGSYYLYTVIKSENEHFQDIIWISWIIYIVGTTLIIYYLYLNTLLLGRGLIKQAQKALVVYNIGFIIIAYCGLFLGYGLIAVSFASLISCVIERIILAHFFYDAWICKVLKEGNTKISDKIEIVKIFWHNAKKMGVVSIGSFLINRMGQFFVTSFFPLKIAAQYGLTLQIATFISSSSIIYFNTMYPKMVFNYYKGKIDNVIKELGLCLAIIFLFFLIAGAFMVFFGNFSLQVISSKTTLLPNIQVILLLLMLLLEIQHSVNANIITFENKIPFVAPALISGFFIISFTYISLYFFAPNVWSVLLVQFLVQLSYNNWKWPLEVSKMLKTPYFKIVDVGFAQMFINIKSMKWKF